MKRIRVVVVSEDDLNRWIIEDKEKRRREYERSIL